MNQGYIPGNPQPYQRSFEPYHPRHSEPNRTRRDPFLLVSAILGLAYSIYLIVYFGGIQSASLSGASETFEDVGKQIAGVLAVRMVTPHIVAACVGAILNAAAWFMRNKWLALGAVLAYAVAAVLFFAYALIVLPMIVLALVGFVRLYGHRA
jgi:hypothetical protein